MSGGYGWYVRGPQTAVPAEIIKRRADGTVDVQELLFNQPRGEIHSVILDWDGTGNRPTQNYFEAFADT